MRSADVVRKWLDGGCSSWGTPVEEIKRLLTDHDHWFCRAQQAGREVERLEGEIAMAREAIRGGVLPLQQERQRADAAEAEVERLSSEMADTDPITQAEMIEMFGEAMPIEAVKALFDASPGKTVGEIRAELRVIANQRATGLPDKSDGD